METGGLGPEKSLFSVILSDDAGRGMLQSWQEGGIMGKAVGNNTNVQKEVNNKHLMPPKHFWKCVKLILAYFILLIWI